MSKIFKKWNESELDSYLIEIVGDILAKQDDDGSFVIDNILDVAGQVRCACGEIVTYRKVPVNGLCLVEWSWECL